MSVANVETSNGNAGSKYTQSAARTISGRCSSGTGFALAITIAVAYDVGSSRPTCAPVEFHGRDIGLQIVGQYIVLHDREEWASCMRWTGTAMISFYYPESEKQRRTPGQ